MAGNILLQNLRVFTKDLSDNDLMLFKIDKRVDMPAKEDMGVTYASFMGQLQLDRFVKKAGDIMSGDLVHINNKGIFATTVDGTTRSVFKMDNTDALLVGSLSTPLKIQSSIDPKVSVAGTESVIYHSGNSNKSTISWAANTLTVAGMANFNGSSWFHGALVKNSPSGLKNMSIEVTDLGVVNFKINNAYTGLVLDSNDQTAKFPDKIFALNNKEVLHTGNFQTPLDSVYVLKTQTVNNKPLTGNIALTWADVGALSADADGKTVTDNLIIKNGKRVQAKTTKDEYADIFTVTVYDTLEVGSSKMTTRIFSDVNPQVSVGGNRGDLYSTLNKPSASDVGLGLVGNYQAVNRAGDTMSGALAINNTLETTKPITYYNPVDKQGFIISANNVGRYSELTRIGTDKVYEWDTGLRCYGGNDWRIGNNRIYHQGFKQTPEELGFGAVSQNADPITVAQRDSSADLSCRLLRSTYANQTTISGAMAFRINNSTDNYTRFCSDKVAIADWMEVVKRSDVNFGQTAGVVGKIPIVGINGAMEIGKYIDFHDTNSTKDYDVRLQANSTSLNIITTGNGTIEIGAKNTAYAHIYTDRPAFAFDKGIRLTSTDSTSWLDTRSSNFCYSTLGAVNTGSASAILRQEHVDRHWMVSGLGNSSFGFFMINKSRTTNGTDAGAYLSADGTWICDGNGNFNDVYIRSDRRLKTELTVIDCSLDKLLRLTPFEYTKKATLESEETFREIGLIAQDVEEIIPLAVNTDDKGMKSLKPYALIATLIGAVKELKAELNELKSQINPTK